MSKGKGERERERESIVQGSTKLSPVDVGQMKYVNIFYLSPNQ